MTTDDYKEAIARLGCRNSTEAGDLLGVSRRMASYYAAGRPIPLPIAKLLRMLLHERLREGQYTPGDDAERASGQLQAS